MACEDDTVGDPERLDQCREPGAFNPLAHDQKACRASLRHRRKGANEPRNVLYRPQRSDGPDDRFAWRADEARKPGPGKGAANISANRRRSESIRSATAPSSSSTRVFPASSTAR